MGAYQQVNGEYASENDNILNTILKEEMDFRGFVVSDWVSGHELYNFGGTFNYSHRSCRVLKRLAGRLQRTGSTSLCRTLKASGT